MLMNDSIKRVQSQAGLSFAERENQRSAAGGKANLRPEVKQKDFMKSAGTRGYSPLARVLTAIVMMFTLATTGAWADTTITWGPAELSTLTDSYLPAGATKTVKGITVTVNAGTNNFLAVSEAGTVFSATNDNAFTFSTELGNFTKIECTSLSLSGTLGDGWDGATWTGDANSVNMSKAGSFLAVSSITFTIGEPAAPATYKVTMKEGTVDAANWTISPTEAAEGKPITATYSGSRHVKSVTAVTKAAAPAGNPAPTTAAIDAYTGGAFAWDGGGSAAAVDVTINTFAANDGISILSDKNTNTKFTTSAGGASATFSGTATDDSKFYAVYPYTDGLTLSGDVITGVVIPSDQWNDKWGNNTSDESSWDPKAPIAYATTEGSSLQFHNLCAILIINPYWGGDGWITISADQNLAGTFSLDTSTGTLTAIAGSKSVTIGSSSDDMKHVMGMGEYMYIAIAPGSYTNFMVRTDEDYGGAEKTKASVTFEAGKIYDLGKVRPY